MGKIDEAAAAIDGEEDVSSLSPEELIYQVSSSREEAFHEAKNGATSSLEHQRRTTEPSSQSSLKSSNLEAKLAALDGSSSLNKSNLGGTGIDDAHEDDEVEAAAAAVPPDLTRATARNLALQPGAFHGGGVNNGVNVRANAVTPTMGRLESFSESNDNTSNAPSYGDFFAPYQPPSPSPSAPSSPSQQRRFGRVRTILEATLVVERDDEEFDIVGTPPEYKAASSPIYKGELLGESGYLTYDEETTVGGGDREQDDASMVPIRKRCLWWVALVACGLVVVTGAAVAAAIVLAVGNGSENDDAAASLTEWKERGSENGIDSTAKTAASNAEAADDASASAEAARYYDEMPIETLMAKYNRITHHVALVTLKSPTEQCSALRDQSLADDGDLFTTAFVTLSCGGRDDGSHHNATATDDDGNAAIFVHNDANLKCERISQSSVRCTMDQSQEDSKRILFTCGTNTSSYHLEKVSSHIASTAAVLVQPTVTECNPTSAVSLDYATNIDSGSDYRPAHVPVVAIFVALGRLCHPHQPHQSIGSNVIEASNSTSFSGGWIQFGTTKGTCNDETQSPLIATESNVTYCIQQQEPCADQNCRVWMDHVSAMDRNVNDECEAASLDESVWFGNADATSSLSASSPTAVSATTAVREALSSLETLHTTFVDRYLDLWFCEDAVIDAIVQRPPE